jgi:hypothetical protein
VAAAPLPVKVSFGESSKASTAQAICINYTKGLSDEQVRERPTLALICAPGHFLMLHHICSGGSYSQVGGKAAEGCGRSP